MLQSGVRFQSRPNDTGECVIAVADIPVDCMGTVYKLQNNSNDCYVMFDQLCDEHALVDALFVVRLTTNALPSLIRIPDT